MKAWALKDGDIQVSDGQIAWIDGREELAQSVRIRMGTRLGEYFFAPDMGLDHDQMMGKQVDEDSIREAVMRCLAEEPRIQSVEELEIDWDERARTVSMRLVIMSADGEEVELNYADGSGFEAQNV
ncbi:contractile injection system sheath initiator [Paenibacillus apiarius]|uniref:DUF2634 domain-containing protein n=1 Tax=Paenibacillus apiarius TaxID=46240 RepID=A0ABT4DX23_9BACL|nr:DUF2634 domain-containing protein [Paenibacillus apiarius]MCY9517935.1 DUF2634 domain-containing protein [Paenibacillus apiarius]MCY9521891.1 DUF2634 domain-containing protein [Paenibacillus apiarius]MCY9554844.1 DUF2634 domain-containing protein [Paenibacillus apiarius]MCY9559023.1 DUF2634 domain-containing protein [Paenibacillus apiarius]MCY9685604.1 DUF2634 domain-containing protein [Paenibacillus apiarius]